MAFRIVCDSSSNVFSLPGVNYTTVPMKVVAEKEYIDTPRCNVVEMVNDLQQHKGRSGSSCPNVGDWLTAFGDETHIFGLTITKHLSGSYNAAQQAARTYMEEHPGRQVHIFDSLSTGPVMMMLVEKILACDAAGDSFSDTIQKVSDYQNHCHTLFCLESLMNLARNGRVNPAVAKIAGTLGIRAVGTAKGGQISLIHKPRGHRKTGQALTAAMAERGFQDGSRLRIAHCFAKEAVENLKTAVLDRFPHATFLVEPTSALCSFYAEAGGLILGFEGNFNAENDNRVY